ncbi:hypothetical protein EIKCOROL_00751 [Eikenella corrodens ATCC 23834]|uniref:Uncharacterized protein n=1 Tax=Eikenella corrodens ATCC 23834 TaxID=546274 RepID=C0DTS1_EIKCO|nr:hypothetical protein EIKCOROL_00751 [Eikenella corrodens ATCC 23834]
MTIQRLPEFQVAFNLIRMWGLCRKGYLKTLRNSATFVSGSLTSRYQAI